MNSRQKKFSRIGQLLSASAAAFLIFGTQLATATSLPAFKVVAAPGLVSPTTANTYYCQHSCDTAGSLDLWATGYPPEITTLANALHKNVDLIYEYVRNNIELAPMYGLQKGALGAIIDQSGTAFDQAQLMVDLLRASGYTASYQAGTVTLTGSQIASWIGNVTDAASLTKILADGGIPATVTPASGTVTSVTLSHIWVQVNIGGTNYLFDPSFKPHTFVAPAIDLGTAMGWSDTGFMTTAQTNMVSGTGTDSTGTVTAPYVSNINNSGIQTTLTSYANNLATYLKTNNLSSTGEPLAAAQIDDLVGRQDIQLFITPSGGLRQTSLPYSATVQHTWGSEIPDVYRTTLDAGIGHDSTNGTDALGIHRKLFVDQIYGRRVAFDFLNLNVNETTAVGMESVLTVDHQAVTPIFVVNGGTHGLAHGLTVDVDHPYAASGPSGTAGTYMDQTQALGNTFSGRQVDAESDVVLITGFGDVSENLLSKLASEARGDETLAPFVYMCFSYAGGFRGVETPCTSESSDPYRPSAHDFSNTKIAADWLAQYTRMAKLQSAIGGGIVQNHHLLGAVFVEHQMFQNPSNAMTVDASISVNSKTGDAGQRRAMASSIASAADALEGSIYEQQMDVSDPASIAARFDYAETNCNTSGVLGSYNCPINHLPRFYLLNANADFSALFPAGGSLDPPGNFHSAFEPAQLYLQDTTLSGLYTSATPYSAIVVDDSFLGPGNYCGAPLHSGFAPGQIPPCKDIASSLRGSALLAFGTSGSSMAFAGVINGGLAGGLKGGGAGDGPIISGEYDPMGAAQLLKDKFKDSTKLFGVDLKSGELTYTAPSDITVGNGEFPYQLTFQRTYRASQAHSPGMSFGWTHNLDRQLQMGSSGMATMGDGPVLPSVSSLVTFYVSQQIYRTQPATASSLLSRWVMEPFVEHWWAAQILHNIVTLTAGTSVEQFVRLPDGSFNPPHGYAASGVSNWQLTQTGQPTQKLDYNNQPVGIWLYSGVSFTLTSPQKDQQVYSYWGHGSLGGRRNAAHGWNIASWTWPNNTISLTYHYDNNTGDVSGIGTDSEPPRLLSVGNSIGRQINLSYNPTSTFSSESASSQVCNLVGVGDPSSRNVTFGCATTLPSGVPTYPPVTTNLLSSVIDAQLLLTQYAYTPVPLSGVSTDFDLGGGNLPRYFTCGALPGARPQCYPSLAQVLLPSDTVNPKQAFTYDALGRVTSYQDGVSIKTPSQRGAYQFFITGGTRGERMDPSGNSYEAYYDKWGRASQFIDELGRTTTASYDGLDRVLSRTYPLGDQTSFGYDAAGNVTSLVNTPYKTSPSVPSSLTVTATYDPSCGKIKTLVDAWGNTGGVTASAHTTTWNYYSTTCLVQNVQQPAVLDAVSNTTKNPLTQYTYTAAGLKDTITDPSGLQVKYEYNDAGDIKRRTVDPNGKNLITQYFYDGSTAIDNAGNGPGNITRVIDPRSKATNYTYDSDRRVTSVALSSSDGSCFKTENSYTGELLTQYRRAKVCTPDESTTTVSNTSWAVTNTQYTASNKPWIVTDPNGYQDISLYDANDRLTDAIQCLNTGAGANGTCPPASMNDYQFLPQRDTHTVYDGAGQPLFVYKGWGTDDQITYAGYQYDDAGKVLATTDANGNTTTNVYDGYERLFRTCWPDSRNACSNINAFLPTDYEQYSYDATGPGNNGNVTGKRNRDALSITYQFDVLNREIIRNVPPNAGGHYGRTLTTTYDLASRKWAETVVDTETGTSTTQTLQNGYDSAKRLMSVADSLLNSLGGTTGNVTYGYDLASNRTSLTFASGGGASWSATYGYDDAERLHSIVNNGTTLATYAPDPLSRRLSVTFADTSQDVYTYYDNDDLKTLTAIYTGGNLNYAFSPNGSHQIIKKAVNDSSYEMQTSSAGQTYATNSLNQYTRVGGNSNYNYDGNGNLISDGTWTYEYDEENRLRSATGPHTALYDYDPEGRRRSKSVDLVKTYFINDGPNEIAELNSSGVRQRIYVNGYGMDDRVATSLDAGSTWDYYHVDHQNSTLMTTHGGAISANYRYGPYGETADAATGNPIRYTGRYLDAETGLYYFRARYYSTAIGRFLQTDPIGSKDDVDLYAYTRNDPINATDPSGLTSYDCTSGGNGCPLQMKLDDMQSGDTIKTDGATVTVGDKGSVTVSLNAGFENGASAANTGPTLVPVAPKDASVDRNIQKAGQMLNPPWFKHQVQNKGPWDYKQEGKKDGMNYEAFGNFNYGAAGRTTFPIGILRQEAGRAQRAAGTSRPEWGSPGMKLFPSTGKGSFGDDPVDQFWIQQGSNYYDANH